MSIALRRSSGLQRELVPCLHPEKNTVNNNYKTHIQPASVAGTDLLGVVTKRDIGHFSEDKWPEATVREIMSKNLLTGFPDESLSDVSRMTKNKRVILP